MKLMWADASAWTQPAKPSGGTMGALLLRIYNSLWYPALPFALMTAGHDTQGRRERLGGAPTEADSGHGQRRVWVHAASVGEIEGLRPVIQRLAQRPDLEFVVTTMTLAGCDAARRRLNRNCGLAPFDHPAAVSAFLARIRPVLVIITETELWPNFFLKSAATGARIAVINARLSSRSMSRYRLIRPLMERTLKSADVVMAQTDDDAERFCRLGATPERVIVTGNTKYEIVDDAQPLRPALASFAKGCPILIAGSTAPGEEQTVLTAYRDLVQRFPSLALVVAPRHLQRVDEVRRTFDASGLAYLPASDSNLDSGQDARVLLLDTMGELGALYRRATIAFVGGSLLPGRGGQSLAEPAAAAVPLLFGPYYENHRQLGDALIAGRGGQIISNSSQLVDACANWLSNEAARRAAGQQARSVMERLAGSTAITIGRLCDLLPA